MTGLKIMENRVAFDEDSAAFVSYFENESKLLADKIVRARKLYPQVACPRKLLYEIASFCLDVGVDGHRGDIIILKTAKTLAAYDGRTEVVSSDIEKAASLALPHRIRRQPMGRCRDGHDPSEKHPKTAGGKSIMIQIEHLSKTFKNVEALKDVNLSVNKGELFAF